MMSIFYMFEFNRHSDNAYWDGGIQFNPKKVERSN